MVIIRRDEVERQLFDQDGKPIAAPTETVSTTAPSTALVNVGTPSPGSSLTAAGLNFPSGLDTDQGSDGPDLDDNTDFPIDFSE